jgi:hypothetical protein
MDGEERGDDADELADGEHGVDGEHDLEEDDEGEQEEALETVTIEISGLSLYTHHGVSSDSACCSICVSTWARPTPR